MASFRPDKNAPRRPLFNWAHRIFGLTAFLCSREFLKREKFSADINKIVRLMLLSNN